MLRGDRRLARQEDKAASCVAGVLIRLLNSKGIAAISPGFQKNNVWNGSDDVIVPGLSRPRPEKPTPEC
jgi:hypothetical protein